MEFECTEDEFRVFENLVEQGFTGSFPYFLGLVLLGEKPATVPSAYGELEFVEERIQDMGLEIKQVDLEFVKTNQTPEYARKPGKTFFLGRDDALSILKDSYNDRTCFRRDFGLAMGYPEEDIEWFLNQEKETYDSFEHNERFDRLTSFVAYMPKPDETNIEKARKTEEHYRKALEKADERFNSSAGKKLIRVLEENQ